MPLISLETREGASSCVCGRKGQEENGEECSRHRGRTSIMVFEAVLGIFLGTDEKLMRLNIVVEWENPMRAGAGRGVGEG